MDAEYFFEIDNRTESAYEDETEDDVEVLQSAEIIDKVLIFKIFDIPAKTKLV